MKSIPKLLLLAVAAALLCSPLAFESQAQDEAPPVAPDRFAGKVAIIYVKEGTADNSVTIIDAKFEKVRDRWFLTGDYPEIDDPDDWLRGSWGAVDWERVESYYLMSLEQFQKQVVDGDFAVSM